MQFARDIWIRIEHLHAVTYFAEECRQTPRDLGLRSFWMAYFANRAAPLGPVAPGVVEATFYNFAPAMVRRSIPEVWTIVAPETLVASRRTAAAAALRRIAPGIEHSATSLAMRLRRAIQAASGAGRPLFAANR